MDRLRCGMFVHAATSTGNSSRGLIRAGNWSALCAFGRGGVVPEKQKQEGDGTTPAGIFPFRSVYYRSDRVEKPRCSLPVIALKPDDGWCDHPADKHYNCAVRHPYPVSAEHLWREDNIYDLIVILGHNDSPVMPGKGSAVFLHIARDNLMPTDGCIALAYHDVVYLLSILGPDSKIEIQGR